MNRLLILTTALLLISLGCRDAAGPSEGQFKGLAVIWFNGLSATADAWYPENDSLVQGAWQTGSAPNQIRVLDDGRAAILSSLSAELMVIDPESTGTVQGHVAFESGSNPYCFDVEGSTGAAALLLTSSLAIFDISGPVTGTIETRANPSGTALHGNVVLVGFANYPDTSSDGGVSFYSLETGMEISWLDTGANTHWLREQPTGMVHAYSTTYTDDGAITIIDPSAMEAAVTIHCGGAPGEGVQVGDEFISPDGNGRGGLVRYSENGSHTRIETPFPPTGLAVSGDTLFASSFALNRVYLMDISDFTVLDSLQAGGEGPQGIVAVQPSR